jgi:hypothetical protein
VFLGIQKVSHQIAPIDYSASSRLRERIEVRGSLAAESRSAILKSSGSPGTRQRSTGNLV